MKEDKKKTAWYVKVVLFFDDGTEVCGSVNIAGYDRAHDYFHHMFKEGGDIMMVGANDKNMVQGSRVVFGVNARRVKMWKPTHETPTREVK